MEEKQHASWSPEASQADNDLPHNTTSSGRIWVPLSHLRIRNVHRRAAPLLGGVMIISARTGLHAEKVQTSSMTKRAIPILQHHARSSNTMHR
jgi:hypothetical protein